MELTRLLVVSDIERSTSWYRDVLGATVEREYGGISLVLRFLGSWVVAVLPNVLAAGTLFAYLRFLRMADELIRLIQLQGLVVGFGAWFFCGMGWELLETGRLPRTPRSSSRRSGWSSVRCTLPGGTDEEPEVPLTNRCTAGRCGCDGRVTGRSGVTWRVYIGASSQSCRRRVAMKRVAVLSAVVMLGVVATLGRTAAQGNVAEIEQVKNNLYVITGGGGNTAAFVTDGGVVVVDTKNPGWGSAILDKIRSVTDKPVTMIVNTHTHGDHVGSNIDFSQPVEVVAHANTKSNMERMEPFQSASGREYLPSRTYQDRLTLLDGEDRIDLYHFGSGHTSGDSIVVFRELGVAHTGDLFAWKGVPYIDVGNGGSGVQYPKTVLAAADAIQGVDTVIPGHSPVMTWADFREFGEFNRDFLAAVERGKAEGKSAAEAAASLNLPARYANYAMSRGTLTSAESNAEKIYAELE